LSVTRLFICCLVASLHLSAADAKAQEGRSFDGLIEPSEVVKLSSPVQGILAEVSVERGDRVKKGQIVARLSSNVERAEVDLAQARVEFAKRKVLRNEELYQKELISIHEKDEMETELRVSELQLDAAKEKLALRTIRCTVDGVVVERLLSPGEYVGVEPILKIARINPLYVEVVVPAERFGTIRKGMVAGVKPELPISGKFIAHVIIVDMVIDAASGTFGVRLEMTNPDYRLPSGLKCKVIFPQ
jgi:membrane fusion protein (multidrug efflux system)